MRNDQASSMQRRKRGQTRITDFYGDPSTNNQPIIRNIEIMDSKISGYQANNQKRIESCEKLAFYCDKRERFIALGQEPSTVENRITGLNRQHKIIAVSNEKPRAYVYLHRDIPNWPLDNLCTRDVATVLIDSPEEDKQRIVACSIY